MTSLRLPLKIAQTLTAAESAALVLAFEVDDGMDGIEDLKKAISGCEEKLAEFQAALPVIEGSVAALDGILKAHASAAGIDVAELRKRVEADAERLLGNDVEPAAADAS